MFFAGYTLTWNADTYEESVSRDCLLTFFSSINPLWQAGNNIFEYGFDFAEIFKLCSGHDTAESKFSPCVTE